MTSLIDSPAHDLRNLSTINESENQERIERIEHARTPSALTKIYELPAGKNRVSGLFDSCPLGCTAAQRSQRSPLCCVMRGSLSLEWTADAGARSDSGNRAQASAPKEQILKDGEQLISSRYKVATCPS